MLLASAADRLKRLTDECTVTIPSAGVTGGSGFFIAPGMVLTCAHVLESWGGKDRPGTATESVPVAWNDSTYHGRARAVPSSHAGDGLWAYPDLAVIELADPPADHPWVILGDQDASADPEVYLAGYNVVYDKAVPRFAGLHGRLDGPQDLADGRAWRIADCEMAPGMSGGPVLQPGAGVVVGIAKTWRLADTAMGGLMIGVSALRKAFPDAWAASAEQAARNRRWLEVLDARPGQDAGPGRSSRPAEPGLGDLLFQTRLQRPSGPFSIGFGPHGTLLVLQSDARLQRWSVDDGHELAGLQLGGSGRTGMVPSTSVPAVAISQGKKLTLVRFTGDEYQVTSQIAMGVNEFLVKGNGERFATNNGRRLSVRDFRDGALVWQHPMPFTVVGLALDVTGTVLAVAESPLALSTLKVTVATQGNPVLQEVSLRNTVVISSQVGLSPGGALLAAVSLRELVLSRPHAGRIVYRRRLQGLGQEIGRAYTVRPERLIPTNGGAVFWLRRRQAALVRGPDDDLHYLPQDGAIDDIAFDYAKSRLATVNSEGLVSVWQWHDRA